MSETPSAGVGPADGEPISIYDEYAAYRHRLDELLHLYFGAINHLEKCEQLPERPTDVIRTLHVVAADHLASFFDNRSDSLNVLRIWPTLFPDRKEEIDRWANGRADDLSKLRALRHKSGSHADRDLRKQSAARVAAMPVVRPILEDLLAFAHSLAKQEKRDPVLVEELRLWGLRDGDIADAE